MYLKSKSILLIIYLVKCNFGFAQSESGVYIKFKNVCNLSTAFKSSNSIILERTEQISIFYEDSQDLVTLDKTKIQTPINVYPRENYIILRHFLNFLDYDDYLFQKNDSILIEYKNKIPIISVFNRKPLFMILILKAFIGNVSNLMNIRLLVNILGY